jgi:hypothetical protein
MNTRTIRVGDLVRCNVPGSFVHGLCLEVLRLDVISSDGINGHLLRLSDRKGVTVVEPEALTVVDAGLRGSDS